MSAIPAVSQLKSLFQWVTGDSEGARRTQDEFVDAWWNHPLNTGSDFLNAIPVVGHIKGVVHFVLGDNEGGVRAEEMATRTVVVLSAAALTIGTDGLAAPILAGVLGGIAADGAITIIESKIHGHPHPHGFVAAAQNVVWAFNQSNYDHLAGDLFDVVTISVMDGFVGLKSVPHGAKSRQTVVHRVEGQRVVKTKSDASLSVFFAADDQRLFSYMGRLVTRETSGVMEDVEVLTKGSKPKGETPFVSITRGGKVEQGNPQAKISLTVGNANEAYGEYAQNLIDQRAYAKQFNELSKAAGYESRLTGDSHQIKLKSFRVMTRDLEKPEIKAITEHAERVEPQGTAKVSVKGHGQFEVDTWRISPILENVVEGSYRVETPWISRLPTKVLELIRDHPQAFGKVRSFHYTKTLVDGFSHISPINLHNITHEEIHMEEVAVDGLLHCRHVKAVARSLNSTWIDWTEHYEYLVKYTDGRTEWVPADLITEDLRKEYQARVMKSAREIQSLEETTQGGMMKVLYTDGTEGKVHSNQLFWQEIDKLEHELDPREVDAILYHMQRQENQVSLQVPVDPRSKFPLKAGVGAVPYVNQDHFEQPAPIYLGWARDFDGGVFPCMVDPDKYRGCALVYNNEVVVHQGKYEILPFDETRMEFQKSVHGLVPRGYHAIVGGYDKDHKVQYHCIARWKDRWMIGRAGPQLNGATMPYISTVRNSTECDMLVWKNH
ncbi:hypothetical protein RJ55_08347 [Drechmeria coniospora]|nr:hypothetical protein RJ55_08347 [Drechmeria coniospora]